MMPQEAAMNRKQKIAIVVGALLVLLAVVFPPMDILVMGTDVDGPALESGEPAQHPIAIDWGRLGLYVLIVLTLTVAAVLVLKDKKA
jgi:hypothetical protein